MIFLPQLQCLAYILGFYIFRLKQMETVLECLVMWCKLRKSGHEEHGKIGLLLRFVHRFKYYALSIDKS